MVAIVKGDVATEEPVLVRMHSSCLTGDLLGSLRCDCGDQLQMALEKIESGGRAASCCTSPRKAAASASSTS